MSFTIDVDTWPDRIRVERGVRPEWLSGDQSLGLRTQLSLDVIHRHRI